MTASSGTPESSPTSPDPDQVPVKDDLAAVAATAPIEGGIGDYFRTYTQRVRSGDMGSLPAVAGLVVLVIVFWILHPSFGSLANFSDLLKQASPTIFIAPKRTTMVLGALRASYAARSTSARAAFTSASNWGRG